MPSCLPSMTRQVDPFLGTSRQRRLLLPAQSWTSTARQARNGSMALPSLLSDYAQRWSLKLLPPFALSYHYVAPAIRADGSPAVLKAGVPISRSQLRNPRTAVVQRQRHGPRAGSRRTGRRPPARTIAAGYDPRQPGGRRPGHPDRGPGDAPGVASRCRRTIPFLR